MRTKKKQYAIRMETSLLNSIELACKQSNVKKSLFIRSALEKAIEGSL